MKGLFQCPPWAKSFCPFRAYRVIPLGVPQLGIPPLGVFPLGVPTDLQSGVKKCPNLLWLCGFAIRSKGVCFSFYCCWGITNPPVLIGRTFFYGGLQIRRDA